MSRLFVCVIYKQKEHHIHFYLSNYFLKLLIKFFNGRSLYYALEFEIEINNKKIGKWEVGLNNKIKQSEEDLKKRKQTKRGKEKKQKKIYRVLSK